MIDRNGINSLYKQNLVNDIVLNIAKLKQIDIREAFDIYYKSQMANQIDDGTFGIDNMDAKYLALDIIENEAELF